MFPGAILINGDHFAIGEQRDGFRTHRGQVISGQERGGKNRPQAHVRAVLIKAHATVADFEHVRIIPMARAGKLSETCLAETDLFHARVVVLDVAGGSPQVATDRDAPLPNRVVAILTEAVDDGAAGLTQSISHLDVGVDHHFVRGLGRFRAFHDVAQAAEIVFQIIDAPCSVSLRLLLLVAVAAFEFRASFRPRCRVDADFESLTVNVIGERFHIREFFV